MNPDKPRTAGTGSVSHDVLAAQFAVSVSKRAAMIDSWLQTSSSSNDTIQTNSDQDQDQDSESPSSHPQFQVLPSSSVGLGSKRAKLDWNQIQVLNNRQQPQLGGSEGVKRQQQLSGLDKLSSSARALNSLRRKTGKSALLQRLQDESVDADNKKNHNSSSDTKASTKSNTGDYSDEDEDEDEKGRGKSHGSKRTANLSFFDSYKGQKKKKKHKHKA